MSQNRQPIDRPFEPHVDLEAEPIGLIAQALANIADRRQQATSGNTVPRFERLDEIDLLTIGELLDEQAAEGTAVDLGVAEDAVRAARTVPEFWDLLSEKSSHGDRGFARFAQILRATNSSAERLDGIGNASPAASRDISPGL